MSRYLAWLATILAAMLLVLNIGLDARLNAAEGRLARLEVSRVVMERQVMDLQATRGRGR